MRPLVLLLLALTIAAQAQPRTASIIGHSQSLLLRSVAMISPPNTTVNFTTYDGLTGAPFRQAVSPGVFRYSGELRPRGGGAYETDYAHVNNLDNSFVAYGSLVLNLPTTDSDGNGLPDFAQRNFSGAASIAGTYQQNFPSSVSVALTGSLTRNANSVSGTYNVVDVATGGTQVNITGVLELVYYSGSISYTRGAPNIISVSISRTNAGAVFALTGTTTFTVASVNQFSLPTFTVTNATDNSVYTVQPAVFNRTGNRYVGALALTDGDTSTAWADYLNWVFEITDANDTDNNGIPNLTDAPPTPPTITVSPAGNNLSLAWSATAGRYRLESTSSLTAPIAWSNATGSLQTNAGTISVVQPVSGARRFYRLVEP